MTDPMPRRDSPGRAPAALDSQRDHALPSDIEAHTRAPSRLRRSRQDRLLVTVHQVLRTHCEHCITPEGAHLLVDRTDGLAYTLEAEAVLGRLKGLALHEAGINVSKGVIQSAIDIIRDEVPSQMPIGYGRAVIDRNGNLYLLTADGVLVINFGETVYHLPDQRPNVSFLLPTHALPVSYKPVYGSAVTHGALSNLLRMLNVPADNELLVIAWMVSCLLPEARKTLLEIIGVPQSGKSTLQAVLKQILDPSRMPLVKTTPKTPKQVDELAKSDHVICLDGVGELRSKIQGELVAVMRGRLVDVSMLGRRSKTMINVARPVLVNSLESIVTERELADRTVTIDLPPIEPGNKIADFYRKAQLQAMIPGGYASLVAILSNAAHRWKYQNPSTSLPSGIEDFFRIGCIVAENLGYNQQVFIDQFEKCLKRRFALELSENPVAFAINSYLKGSGNTCQEMSTGQLMSTLEDYFPELKHDEDWPRNERQFGSAVRASIALLRAHNVDVTPLPKRGGLYRIRLSTLPTAAVGDCPPDEKSS